MVSYVLIPREPLEETLKLADVPSPEARRRLLVGEDDFALDASYSLDMLGVIPANESTPSTANTFVRLPQVGAIIAEFADERLAAQAAEKVPGYEFVPDAPMFLLANAPRAGDEDDPGPGEWRWPVESGISEAHARGVRGQDVLIGVLDTGSDVDHRSFHKTDCTFRYIPLTVSGPRDVRGFDPNGHGTHVCGIIASSEIGVAPAARLWIASVIESETAATSLKRVLAGLNWLLRSFSEPDNRRLPAILNMSLGFYDSSLSPIELGLVRLSLRRILQTMLNRLDILPVVAIGNTAGQVCAPGYFPECLGVGAIDFHGAIAPFSGSGASPINGAFKPDTLG